MPPLLALVDCNSFYVSCECVFRPDLWDKPVGVLSNNDGCFIARNQALKALGIKMGQPLFQVLGLVEKHQVQVFSANFPLYADLSARVMSILETFTPVLEIYSIDEAFLDLTGVVHQDPIGYAQTIRQTVRRYTGIPVCVGLGPTKTLAKLANYAAKAWPKTGGVVDLSNPGRREKLLRITPAKEVWGIGAKTSAQLNQLGIRSAWDLAVTPSDYLKAHCNIQIVRTALELNGIACLDLEPVPADKQQVICSRSFGQSLSTYDALSIALTDYCSRAAEKLRKQGSTTSCISIFIRTNPFNPKGLQYQRSATVKLENPTQDTRIIIAIANRLLKTLFKAGFNYQKCGVQLSNIQPVAAPGQGTLFEYPAVKENPLLMDTLDQINKRFPKTIGIGKSFADKSWKAKSKWLSPRYTTCWDELPKVKA